MYCSNPECSHLKKYGVAADHPAHVTVCAACGAALRQERVPFDGQADVPGDLVDVYTSPDEYKVAVAKSYLEAAGIECLEFGLYAHCVFGGALDSTRQPSLQVRAAQAGRARELLAELDAEPVHAPEWTCSECGPVVPGELDACWRCAGDPPPDADIDLTDDDDSTDDGADGTYDGEDIACDDDTDDGEMSDIGEEAE